jgi:hypothetical protein
MTQEEMRRWAQKEGLEQTSYLPNITAGDTVDVIAWA